MGFEGTEGSGTGNGAPAAGHRRRPSLPVQKAVALLQGDRTHDVVMQDLAALLGRRLPDEPGELTPAAAAELVDELAAGHVTPDERFLFTDDNEVTVIRLIEAAHATKGMRSIIVRKRLGDALRREDDLEPEDERAFDVIVADLASGSRTASPAAVQALDGLRSRFSVTPAPALERPLHILR